MAPPAEARREPTGPSGLSNLQKRLISAAILLPLVITDIYFGHPYFDLLVAAFAGVMAWEWTRICARRRNPADPAPAARLASANWFWPSLFAILGAVAAVLAAGFVPEPPSLEWQILVAAALLSGIAAWPHHRNRALWFTAGTLYVTLPALALLAIRNDPEMGRAMLLWTLGLVVAADTGGYVAGRSIGGPKLAPRISPNKTWAGLAGAVIGAGLAGLFAAFMLNHTNVWGLALLSGALGVVEQLGDLVESAFKRHFGVKDTSHIIPGHGGVLDRIDGLLAVAVAVLVLNEWAGGSVLAWS
ncbi:MAG TPA: phosphatidate cytidylyltransferase [Alphaproteobacteria bacterium]|nr:phosphatidate cytidylyltransferase [Alphaproteobacteria bacterium]